MGLLVAGLASPALAQLDTGSLQGTVRDASGAVIPSAKVPRTDLRTQRTYVVKTNGEGQYICPSLSVALYSVRAEYPGFNQIPVTGIQLNASELHRVGLVMRIGASTQNATVNTDQMQVNKALIIMVNIYSERQDSCLRLEFQHGLARMSSQAL